MIQRFLELSSSQEVDTLQSHHKSQKCEHGHTLHLAKVLEDLFRTCFADNYQTELLGGATEPLYRPSGVGSDHAMHQIFYRDDFFASALHEIAHWCIAGEPRRLQLDFGYWYVPEGRSTADQTRFLSVEVKPQAIELLFSLCADFPFRVSVDNFSENSTQLAESFYRKVIEQALHYVERGLPARSQIFCEALIAYYQPQLQYSSLQQFLFAQLSVLLANINADINSSYRDVQFAASTKVVNKSV